MPFGRVEMEENRIRFVVRATAGSESLSALCREFGISRPTGRKWRDRYRACGCVSGLKEQSRRPHRSPRRSAAKLEQQVIKLQALRLGSAQADDATGQRRSALSVDHRASDSQA